MRFDTTDPAFVVDPYPVYAALREAGPQWWPSAGGWQFRGPAELVLGLS